MVMVMVQSGRGTLLLGNGRWRGPRLTRPFRLYFQGDE